ncbi:MAG: peptidase M61 [Balneola sp.]|jgi:predicted metalloprotease with PDZ domain|nr:peptidase M61 [Balneola sp.]MBE78291.1 peptidase M61 [Balneola sp.]|tara:strand:- start:4730 stop:6520 length:1791 start_codon:yes stop_codon:yes gene_type:complete
MRQVLLTLTISLLTLSLTAQTTTNYEISFDNAVHHEAEISVTFTNLENKVLEVRMSRTSPGRYALHEFAKNVYGVKATDSEGNELEVTRPNPHQWNVSGHDGTVKFEYTLFANRGDGTYSQVDETHAHLNMPATFAWARDYGHRPIEITFDVREDLEWKIATQLKPLKGTTYYAPDLYYFLDSPVEIADFHERQEQLNGQTIKMALHTPASDEEVDEYFGKVMAIVKAQEAVFGELPDFDYGEYVFLNCYMPNASGDGMEHRNSTIVTNSKDLDEPLANTSIGTISHEFVHAWNVERIRPASLEPFDFEEANMSGELWFAEGFTSYYTGLILARAGINEDEEYIEGLDRGLNYVINNPARQFSNPIEMSYQAPFVDAATSVDPQNKDNTFISYYTYGSVLGLALDLSLRSLDDGKNLDDFMKMMWQKFGKTEVPYSVRDIQATLSEYVNDSFAIQFFDNFIFDSKVPDYQKLLANVGVNLTKANPGKASLGTDIEIEEGVGSLESNAIMGSPIYDVGIESEDEITAIAGTKLSDVESVDEILDNYKPGDEVTITFSRWGEEKTVNVTLTEDPSLKTELNSKADKKKKDRRSAWLKN